MWSGSMSRHLAIVLLVLSAAPVQSFAQSAEATPPDPAKLIEALKSKATRGTTPTSPADAEASRKNDELIQALKEKATRGLSVSDRRQLAEATSDKPAVDLEINFGFNSADITERNRAVVMALGQTLTSDTLKGESFMVAGHTDAKGRSSYNQKLSERRAQAVKDFLISKFGLKDHQLMAVGYGAERLKEKAQPYADANRRVQVVNITPAVAMTRP